MTAILGCLLETQRWWGRETQGQGAILVLERSRAHITWSRQEMSERCVEVGAEWVLWLDDDAVPPMDLAARLYAHQKDMVVPIFFKRAPPYDHTLANVIHDGVGVRMEAVDPFPPRLFRVDVAGMHAVLVRGDVMARMFSGGEWIFHAGKKLGEDYAFFQVAKALGFELWCDSTIEVGHVETRVIGAREHLAACQ
jgi:hypothetical protein